MSAHTPHELHDEFPQDEALLRRLKQENPHFRKLSDRYHEVNRAVHRIETEVEPASDEHAEELKKQRLSLVDEISGLLAKARAAAG
ncbi:YdcH family protein [Altererythrobacter sp.]|uniref:YdcH family protein n=1 Tax=Altererythrobacter sp. TaxID=1872480 RepID=UPI003D00E88B